MFTSAEAWRERRKGRGRRASDAAASAPESQGRRESDRAALAHGDASSIRVSVEKIDGLVNLVGELVITEAMLSQQLGGDAERAGIAGLADLARHTRNLQEAVMAIRMVPISAVFSRFPRMVRELSQRLGKEVEIKLSGEATELDRGLIERITDPLTHLVRNAIDHGIETPEARLAAGKPRVGTISLAASQRGGRILIEVRDDGRGLDRARILKRAAERGMAIPADAPDQEVWRVIFEPGFSTAEAVTDVSGRGVGMDVVRRNIQLLGGSVELSSTPGAGMAVTVSVPLTLAIIEAMTVGAAGETYVLPLASVIESLRVQEQEIRGIAGQGSTLRVRDEYLPVRRLGRADNIAVIVESEGARAALLVDELIGQQQVVVKSLEANFRKVPGISGATIMGDGKVALILDLAHIIGHGAGRATCKLH
jgi:two-component system chemotaxis sensor kinase CheA